jgi:NADPH:quinone reductase
VDYSSENLQARLFEITDGRGVDLALDAYGGAVREACVAALAPGGRLIHFGNSSGNCERVPSPADQRESLIGIFGFSLRQYRLRKPDAVAAGARLVCGWAAEGNLTVPIDRVLPLEAAAESHRLLESREVVGKLLLDPSRAVASFDRQAGAALTHS